MHIYRSIKNIFNESVANIYNTKSNSTASILDTQTRLYIISVAFPMPAPTVLATPFLVSSA